MDSRKVVELISETATHISKIEPGTIITHLNLETLLGVGRLDKKHTYYNLVKKLKDELKVNYGLFLHVETKIGYSLAKTGKEINLCVGTFYAGVKKMYKATADTQFIRIDKIEDEQEREKTVKIANKMANIASLSKSGINTLQIESA